MAGLEMWRQRAGVFSRIRRFFAERGVIEVETPLLATAGNPDPAIDPFTTEYAGGGLAPCRLFLQTSPEFAMKRLLAAGSGPIFQICKAFRNGERGPRHNPEFTLLEWYRPHWDHHRLMQEVAELVQALLGRELPLVYHSYRSLFRSHLGIDPFVADCRILDARARDLGIEVQGNRDLSRDAWLDLLLSHYIESRLPGDRLVFIYDYPASQASLARIRPGDPPLAERFELYLGGMELANGFHELTDAGEQRRRFQAEREERLHRGLPDIPPDERLLSALREGLPPCSGVALGLDRLLMVKTGVKEIAEVLAFPLERS